MTSSTRRLGTVACYVGLVVISVATILPLLYMVSLALQTDGETMSGDPVIVPESPQWGNFATLFERAPFGRFILNSLLVAGGITVAHLVFDPLAGYVFAKFRFRFRNVLFILMMATLAVPFFVRMLPLYEIFADLGWINTYHGLITPFLMSAFGIFLMRQFIQPLPDELIDAARVDGASELRIFVRIILPQVKPALAVLAVFTFVFQWNEFLWPLVATTTTEMRTIPVGLTLFSQEHFMIWNLTAAGGVLMFLPTVIAFLTSQRFFERSIASSGLK